ncbi:SpoIID/LytB domain-containing protein [Striga asiatica]|uniref:SpoIID/LytB domain-containing protein n=1 Tax=Striga asiatica TaxID=4170 RepID=A0A5A7RC80_STRAF|nr:SpoIID/LytB domain-containing protein [Striga asiatica]
MTSYTNGVEVTGIAIQTERDGAGDERPTDGEFSGAVGKNGRSGISHPCSTGEEKLLAGEGQLDCREGGLSEDVGCCSQSTRTGYPSDFREPPVSATRTKSEAMMKRAADRIREPSPPVSTTFDDLDPFSPIITQFLEEVDRSTVEKLKNTSKGNEPDIPMDAVHEMSTGEIGKTNVAQPPCYDMVVVPDPNTTILESAEIK